MPDWIFVTGGVLSGLGKGLVSASISKLIQQRDIEVVPMKCDGYLNVDPGTMNPHEHGEVFVLSDGTEVDMDFGHYERFLDVEGTGDWNLTSGKVFQRVIDRERSGDYLGETVQMVPHVTEEIKEMWRENAEAEDADVVIVEVGGTVGDIENMLYLEAARQIRRELPDSDTLLVHTTLVPYLETTGEQKTKPTQHSVKELRGMGIRPDIIVGRSEEELTDTAVEKIALFCDVEEEEVISDPNLDTVYELPLKFKEQDVERILERSLGLSGSQADMEDWRERVRALKSEPLASVGICGKYTEMEDSYASVEEALKHAAAELGGSVKIDYIDSETLDDGELDGFDGIIVPGGFGVRGVEGKMEAIESCRQSGKPLLGLCYGMQLMVIEFMRNEVGVHAVSEEWGDREGVPVVAELPGQKEVEEMGGTMRLGDYKADVSGKVREIYGSETVVERHRHRYEVDPQHVDSLEEDGLKVTGWHGNLPEYVELENHPFFIGTQAHPEFTSTLRDPNPLYLSFLRECL